MALTPTSPTEPKVETQPLKKEPTQSVYIADQDVVKNYPISLSNDEIDFDIQTAVRGKKPEEYYVNFLPMRAIQNGFRAVTNPLYAAQDAGEEVGKAAAKSWVEFEREQLDPALKLVAVRPDIALGFPQDEVKPEDIEQVYKPWLDIWRESTVGSAATEVSDKFLVNAPTAIAVVPWFVAEFVPDQLLEFGTKPLNWVGSYGVEKFGPPVLNAALSKLPAPVREVLLKDLFAAEKSLAPDFDTLGVQMNARTSDVVDAFKKAARVTHPDLGGNADEFMKVKTSFDNIMKSRGTWYDKLFDMFRETAASVAPPKRVGSMLANNRGSVLVPSAGDLVKVGSEVGKVMKISGNVAAVNLAGKLIRANLDQLSIVPNESQRQSKLRSFIQGKDLDNPAAVKEADFVLQNLDDFDAAYQAKLKKEYKTENPNIISADVARTAEMKGRGKLTEQGAADRHAGSSAYSKLRYEEMLSNPALADTDVTVMAGVSGAGKTGAVRRLAPKVYAENIIYDTNIADVKSGTRIIEKALASNPDRQVDVFYVDRDPVKAFEEGVVPRYLDPKGDKRVVSIPTHVNNMKSRQAIQDLAELYKDNDRVRFHVVGNYGKKGEYSAIRLEDLKKNVYNPEEVKEKLERSVQEKLNAGTLSKEAAAAFLGGTKVPSRGPSKGSAARPDESAVNLENLQVSDDARARLIDATDDLKEKLENQSGKPLTHEEVLEKAKEAEILTKGVSREATLEFQAALLKTRQHLAALAEENELTPEFLDALRVTANLGTDIARNLESFKIEAVPEYAAVKMKVIRDLIKMGKTSEEILKAAQGVDFTKEKSVAQFYRKFVKPTLPEMLDEFVYMNILSSPLTHIVNSFSNALQLVGINPMTKLASGAVDAVASNLTGKARKHYVSEVPDFYKGTVNALPNAVKNALAALKGEKNLERPDLNHIPTLSKVVDIATLGIGKFVPRALEASDVFFRTLVEGGEVEAFSKNLGHTPDKKELMKIKKQARDRADYYVFRQKPDGDNATGQGKLLSAIDQMTNAIYRVRSVPGFKWFIRFVQTPMNILKQGIEYSPAGIATMPGAKDKGEQAGKAIIGSMVFAAASWLAANRLTTWSSPNSAAEKNEFYAAGLQPYSVRIGDKWVSYSKLGPLSYPLAMGAALHHYLEESPDALTDTEMDKVVDAMTGVMRFFSDQSYMQGLGDLVGFARGEKTKAFGSIPTQLVPLSSLQGWVNNIIDPLQRKAKKGLSIESVVDQIQMKVVAMSKNVPSQIDAEEVPVKKQLRGVNAVSPVRVSQVDEGKLSEYRDTQRTKQELNKVKKELS